MSYIDNYVRNWGLAGLFYEVTKIYLTSQDPGTIYADISTYAIAEKSSPTVGTPTDRDGGGSELIFPEITDGVALATGTATHYAVVLGEQDTVGFVGEISPAMTITLGVDVIMPSFSIGIP